VGGIDIDSILSSILSEDSPASGLCELAQFSELNLRVLMPVDRVHLSTQSNAWTVQKLSAGRPLAR
jgi:hypothetical protein